MTDTKDIPPDPSIPKNRPLTDIVRGVVRDELSSPQNLPAAFVHWVPSAVLLEALQHGHSHRNDGTDPIPIEAASATSSMVVLAQDSFSVSDTYTPPVGAVTLIVEGAGGGGGGGGAISAAAISAVFGAGGGGSGVYKRVLINNTTSALTALESSYTVTVGTGGVGGTSAGGTDGDAGLDTAFEGDDTATVYLFASGGDPGRGVRGLTSTPSGGSGGVGGNSGDSGTYYLGGAGGATPVFGGKPSSVMPWDVNQPHSGTTGSGGSGGVPFGVAGPWTGSRGGVGGNGVLVVTAYG